MPNASAASWARSSALTQAALAELGDEPARSGSGSATAADAGRVAGGRAEERRAADVDHLDRLVDADELGPDWPARTA